MKVCSSAKLIRVVGAGNDKGGWGPAGSNALVSSTREVLFSIEIQFDGTGYLLWCDSGDGVFYDDSLHPTLEEAKRVAFENLGVAFDEWKN